MHKLLHAGLSGAVFTKCGDVRSSKDYIAVTDKDEDVTCKKCLEVMAVQSAIAKASNNLS